MSAMPLFQLNPRLAVAASMVRPGARVADVGTDHGYLPIWLVKAGVCPRAVAVDLRPGPLARARDNLRRYQVEEAISLRLSDGLSEVSPREADDIVAAGMGGELIASILAAALWLRDPAKRLILQPMSSAEDLRLFLWENGFQILREVAVRDAGRVYTVISAAFSGRAQGEQPLLYPFLGGLECAASPEAREYAQRQLRHLVNIEKGAAACGEAQKQALAARRVALLRGLLK